MISRFSKKTRFDLNESSVQKIANFGEAISSPTRLKILLAIEKGSRTITSISKATGVPTSNVIFHLDKLEKAGIIYTVSLNGPILTAMSVENVLLCFRNAKAKKEDNSLYEFFEYEIPVWNYLQIEDETNFISLFGKNGKLANVSMENPFDPSRIEAGLVSFRCGKIVYQLQAPDQKKKLNEITISLEICSEAPAYQNDFPSDISFAIGNRALFTWTCPGDFGGRRGILNPGSYPNNYSQYGQLKTMSINKKGTFFDGEMVNSITIDDLDLSNRNQRILSLFNPIESNKKGGMNIFGRTFGDYPQDIKVAYAYGQSKNKKHD